LEHLHRACFAFDRTLGGANEESYRASLIRAEVWEELRRENKAEQALGRLLMSQESPKRRLEVLERLKILYLRGRRWGQVRTTQEAIVVTQISQVPY